MMVSLIERAVRARVAVDVEQLRNVLDPNVTFRLIGGSLNAFPLPRRRFGADALIQMAIELRMVFEHVESVILDMTIEGDRAVVLRKSTVANVGTGRVYEIHATDWIRVSKGRIVEMLEMTDGAVSVAAAGD
jgi:ketosteroid isomerase-like protein